MSIRDDYKLVRFLGGPMDGQVIGVEATAAYFNAYNIVSDSCRVYSELDEKRVVPPYAFPETVVYEFHTLVLFGARITVGIPEGEKEDQLMLFGKWLVAKIAEGVKK